MWTYRGQKRPDFAVMPKPGQESVWDYPRPPELVRDGRPVKVCYEDQVIAESNSVCRLLETASPPSFYIPAQDVNWALLRSAAGTSACEWKGVAQYWELAADPEAGVVGWSYPAPKGAYQKIRDYVSFYPSKLNCYVAGEKVGPQPGKFYGGWVTGEIVGPFKGEPGTGHW
ncbi:MAG: DUF427 domain-containing protein [Deltaproteobacteria bacterium]|nr:DUF427 domain-containing protein [Deltaproteobacteria bacterium]